MAVAGAITGIPRRSRGQATATVPTVIVAIDYDPLATGYVASLAHPGGNITGMFLQQPQLGAKRVEILKEALPKVIRVGVLWNALGTDQVKALETPAKTLGVHLLSIEVKSPAYDFAAAIDAAVRGHAGALLAYGADLESMFRAAAVHVDKILKGAKPADLPMEQPTKYDLVVNMKTAKALRVRLAPSLVQRADLIIR